MNARQQINKQILEALLAANEAAPDQRFGQLLVNADITVDIAPNIGNWNGPCNVVSYQEESAETLKRMSDSKFISRLNRC
jgi:hypothetical protein